MSINFSNVNISLNEFQRISNGKYNAGEMKLESETTLGKINHHVHITGSNDKSLSHQEVLAIKNAFVKALSSNGVAEVEIARIRRDLGLAAGAGIDKTLHERSLKPLTRQQVREILDRNAAAINSNQGKNGDRVFIVSQALGAGAPDAGRVARRDEVNAALADTRVTKEHDGVALAEAVVAGDVDFRSYKDSQALLAQARAQRAQILERTGGRPSAEREAVVEFRIRATGQTVRIPTGRSEAAFAHRLDEMIGRLLEVHATDQRCIDVRTAFGALASPAARRDWLDGLAGAPDAGFKVRTAAILMLTESGIDDWATLSLVNRVNDADALAFAKSLASLDGRFRGDALRNDQLVLSLSHLAANGPDVPQNDRASVPATSPKQWNDSINEAIVRRRPENLPHDIRALLDEVPGFLRERFGEDIIGLRETGAGYIGSSDVDKILPEDPAQPATPDNMRARLFDYVEKRAARSYALRLVGNALTAAGGCDMLPDDLLNDWIETRPQLVQRLCAARTAAESEAVFAESREVIEADAKRFVAVGRSLAKAVSIVRDTLATRLGVPLACLSKGISLQKFGYAVDDLGHKIRRGQIPAGTPEEIEAAVRDLAERTAVRRADILAGVENMEGLSPALRDALLEHAFAIDTPEKLDVAQIVSKARAELAGLAAAVDTALVSGAPKATVYDTMRILSNRLPNLIQSLFPPDKRPGAEELGTHGNALMMVVIHDRQGFAGRLAAFFARPDVKSDNMYDVDSPAYSSRRFLEALPDPGAKAALASSLGTAGMPPFHARALMRAFEDAGLGNLSVASRMAVLRPSHPAGAALAAAVAAEPGAVSPSRLRELAAPILRARVNAANAAIPQADTARMESVLARYDGGLSPADKARLREYAASLDFSEAGAAASEKTLAKRLDEICGGGHFNNPASSASRRALAAGFTLADLPVLARVAESIKDECETREEAVEAILDPQSDFRRGWDAALLHHHDVNNQPERLATLRPEIKINAARAVALAKDDADLLAIVTGGIDRVTVNGASQIRSVAAVERIVADVRANLAELREATAGDPEAYAAGLDMLKGLEARRVPPGFIKHLVDSVRRAPVDALAKLRARSSAADIHAALLQFNRNADAILDAKKSQGLLDGADEIQVCRGFLARMMVARLTAAQRQSVRAALATQDAAQLVAFYDEVGQDNVEMPAMPIGVRTDVQRIGAMLVRDAPLLFRTVRSALGEANMAGGIPALQGEIDMGRIGAGAVFAQIQRAAEAECAAAVEAYLRETFPGTSLASVAMRGIYARLLAALQSTDSSLSLGAAFNASVARMLNMTIVFGAKTLATKPFADSLFAKDRSLGMDVILPGGARLSTDPVKAADELARFVTGREDAAYAQLAPAERNQVHAVMTLLTRDSGRVVIEGVSTALDPEGKAPTFSYDSGVNACTHTFRLERDPDDQIVVTYDTTIRPTHLRAGDDMIPFGAGSQLRGSYQLTFPTAKMNVIGGLDFAACDTAPAQETLNANPPVAHKMTAAVNQLPLPFRIPLTPHVGFGFVLN